MELAHNPLRFFLGSSCPTGFFSTAERLYDPFDGWRTYLLKGGAGSGKSTFLKHIANRAGESAEVFCCSADPRSLDGVCLPSRKMVVLDATAPHTLEPRVWGGCEQLIPLSLCTDETRLYHHRDEIIRLLREQETCHRRARRLLSGAASLLAQNRRTAREGVDEQALEKTANRLTSAEWEPSPTKGREETRLLSAVTPDGVVTLFETVQTLCPRLYAVVDEYGAVAPKLLQKLKAKALADGHHVVLSPSPLFPDTVIEHLWLPQIGVAFLTSNRWHPVDFPVYRRLHTTRFWDESILEKHRHQLAFRQKTANELLDGASAALAEAHTWHDKLETRTATATDWQTASHLCERFLEKMGI